jgi:hypothetical protein
MVREIRLPAVYIFTGLRWEILIRAKECSFEIMGLSETFLKKKWKAEGRSARPLCWALVFFRVGARCNVPLPCCRRGMSNPPEQGTSFLCSGNL